MTIFDLKTIGSGKRPRCDTTCLVVVAVWCMAQGICFTLVNGHVLYEHGKPTEARAGQVLRGA